MIIESRGRLLSLSLERLLDLLWQAVVVVWRNHTPALPPEVSLDHTAIDLLADLLATLVRQFVLPERAIHCRWSALALALALPLPLAFLAVRNPDPRATFGALATALARSLWLGSHRSRLLEPWLGGGGGRTLAALALGHRGGLSCQIGNRQEGTALGSLRETL